MTDHTYRVRVIVDGVDRGSFTVTAPHAGLAQTRAIGALFAAIDSGADPVPFPSGAAVEYDVTPDLLADATAAAVASFWQTLAATTGATTGDLSPDTAERFESAAADAAAAWYAANVTTGDRS